MRGKAGYRSRNFLTFRITPAYAGKRICVGLASGVGRDHPRLCGEKPYTITSTGIIPGSPPPMRGKARFIVSAIELHRITPAYAGKRVSAEELFSAIEDHPRLCGEKRHRSGFRSSAAGSPPPMRGKAPAGCCPACTGRITPAYAGKSACFFPLCISELGSPPPMRGKVWSKTRCVDDIYGSPPPMRGKGELSCLFFFQKRITPAYAGKRRIAVGTAALN